MLSTLLNGLESFCDSAHVGRRDFTAHCDGFLLSSPTRRRVITCGEDKLMNSADHRNEEASHPAPQLALVFADRAAYKGRQHGSQPDIITQAIEGHPGGRYCVVWFEGDVPIILRVCHDNTKAAIKMVSDVVAETKQPSNRNVAVMLLVPAPSHWGETIRTIFAEHSTATCHATVH